MRRQSSYKVHINTISNGELSNPLCDNVNRGLTLVRLLIHWLELETYDWLTTENISILLPKTSQYHKVVSPLNK